MTEAKQPEALRLAEILEGDYCPDWFYEQGVDEVAAELRRQHARIAELEAQLEAIGAGGVSGPLMGCTSLAASAGSEPVATVFTMEALASGGGVTSHAIVHKPLPAGTKLYTTPQPTQAQAGAVPLTLEAINTMAREHPAEDLCGWSYRMGIADTERHHGIKGGQHGTE